MNSESPNSGVACGILALCVLAWPLCAAASETLSVPAAAVRALEKGRRVKGTTADALLERRAHFADAVEAAPNWAEAHLELGKVISLQGDGPAAIRHLTKACELSPRDPAMWSELALACRRAGRLADAISNYTQALSLAPNDSRVHNNFGVALLDAGQQGGRSSISERRPRSTRNTPTRSST